MIWTRVRRTGAQRDDPACARDTGQEARQAARALPDTARDRGNPRWARSDDVARAPRLCAAAGCGSDRSAPVRVNRPEMRSTSVPAPTCDVAAKGGRNDARH
jgi:hypothetical protein